MQIKHPLVLLIIFINIIISNSYSQLTKEKIDVVYNFKASEISGADMLKKQKEIDLFWTDIKQDSLTGFLNIKKEVMKSGYSSYFYYDMANFLSIYSPKKEDQKYIEYALSNVKWEDMRTWEYVEKLRSFSTVGINVSSAVMGLLNQSKLKIKHEITGEQFNQGKLLGYILLPAERHDYLQFMNGIFDTLNPESQRSVVTLFWMTNSLKADELLASIAENKRGKRLTEEVVLYADRLLKHFNPNQDEMLAFDTILLEMRTTKLIHDYTSSIHNWSDKSWDNLIKTTKLMHYYKIQLE